MLRWAFLFVLLANALSLLWYSSQSAMVSRGDTYHADIDVLRLVSEVNPKLLTLVSQEAYVSSCVEFIGFASRDQASAVKRFVGEQGFVSVVYNAGKRYNVIITLSQRSDVRERVVDYLVKNEGLLSREKLEAEYSITGFEHRAEAELARDKLRAVQIPAHIELDHPNAAYFNVQVFEFADRKLSNKIKEVVMESYSVQKNEKKVCQRVASLRSTE